MRAGPFCGPLVGSTVLLFTALVAAAAAQQTPPAGDPVSESMRRAWEGAKRNVAESASSMPEDGYAFRPVETVRTFGEILAHVAGANYVFCSGARGEESPHAEDEFEKSAKTKAAIVKALTESLDYCDAAFASLTDAKAAESIDLPFGMGRGARATVLLGNIGHLNEHYGNLVTYFRIKGMVPPSSARSQ